MECGNKATIRCREEKRKNGTVWKGTYFICSKRNNYSGLCDCKQISANLIEEAVNEKIKEEVQKINFSEKEIKQIYEQAEKEAKSKSNLLQTKLQELKYILKNIENTIEEIYEDKVNKIIQIEDFKIIYEKKQKERNKILKEIKEMETQLEESDKKTLEFDFKEIKQIAKEFLKIEKPNKMILEKLIEKIEFDKEKNIKIKFYFSKIS